MYSNPTDGHHEIVVETCSSLGDLRAAVERVIERVSGVQLLAVEAERPIAILVGRERTLPAGDPRRARPLRAKRPRSAVSDPRRMRVLYAGDTPASTVVALLMREPEVASAEPRPFATPAGAPS